MRIGLDLSPLTHPHPPGVARVAHELSQLLAKSERFEFVEVGVLHHDTKSVTMLLRTSG